MHNHNETNSILDISFRTFNNLEGSNNSKCTYPYFNNEVISVRLNKRWFTTDLLWSSGNGQQIEIDRIIAIYMSSPDQRNTDALVQLFGTTRVIDIIQKNFDFNSTTINIKEIALSQIKYSSSLKTKKKKEITRNINIIKLSKSLEKASQKTVDAILGRISPSIMYAAAKQTRFPNSFIIEDKIRYSIEKSNANSNKLAML